MILTTTQSAAIRHVDEVASRQQSAPIAAIRSSLAEASVDMAAFLDVSAATHSAA
jgi:hypothetical protein